MHNDNPLTGEETVKGSSDARPALRPELEQAASHGTRMRESQIRAMLGKELHKSGVICENINSPGLYLGQNARVEILNLI